MLKNVVMTSLIVSSSLITTACRSDAVRGVLVGGFVDEEAMTTTVLIPASEGSVFPIYFELRQGATICLLTGEIRQGIVPLFGICEGSQGSGNISCNDGRTRRLQWSLSSCQGGYGYSSDRVGPRFFFGFEQTEEKARDQLMAARQAGEKSQEPAPVYFLWQ